MSLKIKKFQISNLLRTKARVRDENQSIPAEIDPDGMKEAEKIVAKMKKQCPEAVQQYLAELSALWDDMQDLPDNDERKKLSEHAFTLAHQIKDMSEMAEAYLTAYFAESLRDYIGETDINLSAQKVIIQAHIDAMNIIEKQGVQDEQSALAEELKTMVKIAVEKYR